jgi:hypothetical protein
MRNRNIVYIKLLAKSEGTRKLGEHIGRWDDNIKITLRK